MPRVNGYEIGPSADLASAILSGADLRKAILPRANLLNADLSGADLTRADLSEADLRGADLSGADLFGANLTLADLRGANLTLADLFGAKLRGAIWDSTTKWPEGFTPPLWKALAKAMPNNQAEAGWLPDPLGRYQYRYWENGEWSGHVSTGGVTAWDPLNAIQARGQTDAGNMNPLKAVEAGFKNYVNFSGRATRAQFFYWHLFTLLLVVVLGPIGEALWAFTIIPSVSIAFRRMHDSGHSGLWIFCPIMNIVFYCTSSDPLMNAYGPPLAPSKKAMR